MSKYEYKVVPAPKKGLKSKGIKSAEDRFANALMTVMNELGAAGWEYQRSDTLPCEERTGMMGKSTTFQNMLIFRRDVQVETDQPESAAAMATTVASETIAQAHAPLLNGTTADDHGNAPVLGPATDAVEVREPRTDATAQ